MSRKFKIIEKSVVYKGFFTMLKYRVQHSLFNGGESQVYTRELLERGHAVAVFLYDPERDEVVLIEQFRVGAVESDNPWVVELVAGMVEAGETPEDVARREAEEECGARIANLTFIAEFYGSVGGCSEKTTLFYAQIDSRSVEGVHGLASENEDIKVIKLSSAEFLAKLESNGFKTGSLVAAGFWFKSFLKNVEV